MLRVNGLAAKIASGLTPAPGSSLLWTLLKAMLWAMLLALPGCEPGLPGDAPQANAGEDVYPENGLPKNESVTLKIAVGETGVGKEFMQYAIDAFGKKFPNVRFEALYSPAVNAILSAKIAADDDEAMYDLFMGAPLGGLTELAKEGKLENQDDLWSRKAYDSDKTLMELSWQGLYEGSPREFGRSYLLPFSATATGLFFDKTLFAKHGWNQNPRTWQEFLDLCSRIQAAGISPITFPGKSPGYLSYAFSGAWKQFELADHRGELYRFESVYRQYGLPLYLAAESVEMWSRIAELGRRGYFQQGLADMSYAQSQDQVLQGKAALVPSGIWIENEMKALAPKQLEWGFMLVPYGQKPDDAKWTRLTAGNGLYVWANRPELNKKWAKEFSVWMWNLDVQQVLVEKSGSLSIRTDFMNDPARMASVQQAPKAFLTYAREHRVRFENGYRRVTVSSPYLSQASKLMIDHIPGIVSGGQEPLPVLREAEALARRTLAEGVADSLAGSQAGADSGVEGDADKIAGSGADGLADRFADNGAGKLADSIADNGAGKLAASIADNGADRLADRFAGEGADGLADNSVRD